MARRSRQVYADVVMLKTCSILVLTLLFCSALAAAEDYPVGDKPFRRYVAKGRDGQRITFYLSTQQTPSHPVPLIVWVQGTGCSSEFVSVGGRMSRGLQGVLDSVARGRAASWRSRSQGLSFWTIRPMTVSTPALAVQNFEPSSRLTVGPQPLRMQSKRRRSYLVSTQRRHS